MVFKCQEDSFLKEYTGKVISCEKSKFQLDGSKDEIEGFKVILDETILFPEGGGQPCDYGTLNGKQVHNVIRDGSQAVIYVESDCPFTPGEEVKQIIEWPRRLDHMQQHSGQHLITALFDREYGYDTKSWWLGTDTSYIELNAKDVTKENLMHVESLANQLIVEGRSVSVVLTTKEEGIKFQDIRAPRGLPDDHVGPVRVIVIEGLESNMCCGTHVTNLSQLQAVKLLHVEKAKGKLFVHFLVGNRVVRKLEECYTRELQINNILSGGPASHIDLIEKIQANLKIKQKSLQNVLKDFAVAEAEKVKAMNPLPKYYFLHRRDGIEPDFINKFLRNVPEGIFYFLTVGDNTGKGNMMLRGDEEFITKLSSTLLELLDGKGNGKGKLFQAKVNNLNKIAECEKKIKEVFESS